MGFLHHFTKEGKLIGVALRAEALSRQCCPNKHCRLHPRTGCDHSNNTAGLGDEPAVLFDLTLPTWAMTMFNSAGLGDEPVVLFSSTLSVCNTNRHCLRSWEQLHEECFQKPYSSSPIAGSQG